MPEPGSARQLGGRRGFRDRCGNRALIPEPGGSQDPNMMVLGSNSHYRDGIWDLIPPDLSTWTLWGLRKSWIHCFLYAVLSVLGGSLDFVTTCRWACNPTCSWGGLCTPVSGGYTCVG